MAKSPATLIRKFTFIRILVVFFLAILGGLTTLAILFYRNSQSFNNTALLVTHTREVIDETSIVSSLSKDLQWEARNYTLTGNTKSLEQYHKIMDSLHTSAARALVFLQRISNIYFNVFSERRIRVVLGELV